MKRFESNRPPVERIPPDGGKTPVGGATAEAIIEDGRMGVE
jgi:hypothetical protein